MSAKTTTTVEATKDPYRPRVYIVGGGYEYIRLMFNLGYDGAKGVDDADIVLFTGGEDVTPEMYGEAAMPRTNFNRLRDEVESLIFEAALERGIPMVGICRGGQFLNVKNGGKMWQHVNNHCVKSHVARIEVPPFHKNKRRTINVTSTHHQMMIPTEDAIILCTAMEATEKDSPGLAIAGNAEDRPDIEFVWYQDTNCLCFQPHPEFANAPPECVDFFEECMDNWVVPMTPDPRKEEVKASQSITANL